MLKRTKSTSFYTLLVNVGEELMINAWRFHSPPTRMPSALKQLPTEEVELLLREMMER